MSLNRTKAKQALICGGLWSTVADPHAAYWAMRVELEALIELGWPDWAIDLWFDVKET